MRFAILNIVKHMKLKLNKLLNIEHTPNLWWKTNNITKFTNSAFQHY